MPLGGMVTMGAISAGTSLLGGMFGNGAQKDLLKTQNETMKFGLGKMKTLLPQAEGDLGQAENYWGNLLNGNRNAQMSAVGPEVSNISSQYQAGRKAAAEFSGRGGGRMAKLQSSRFDQVGAVTNLLNSQKGKAAGEMTNIASILGQLGLNAGQLGQSAASGVQTSIDANNKQQEGLGQGIGSILAMLMSKKKGSDGGWGGPTSGADLSTAEFDNTAIG